MSAGPEGTPYANGCFFFDLHLHNYPQESPQVQFLTTGNGRVRFNPNLYNCGKVCLSLLGTWEGPGWVSGKSTILQVLVSIQGLILVPDPYYNEPGVHRKIPGSQQASEQYNATIRQHTLQYAILDVVQRAAQSILAALVDDDDGKGATSVTPLVYPEFSQVVVRHFAVKASALERQLQEWTRHNQSLDPLAKQIRQHLAVIVQHYEQQQLQQHQQQQEAELCMKPAATRKTPETIVLLIE